MLVLLAAILAGLFALQVWRIADRRAEAKVWRRLKAHAADDGVTFNESLIADLPDPAQRYFRFTIKPGARLRTVAEIEMHGELGLGSKERPNYAPMFASQILAPPYGLIWRVKAGSFAGADGLSPEVSWTRFWLFKLLPVVRAGGDADHLRSAFGRLAGEAVFWAPATLLPRQGIKWEAAGDKTARATIEFNGMTQTVDVTIDDDGRPVSVVFPRWSNANEAKTYQLQPFGGYLSEFREFDGYSLPTRVEGGNFAGTDAYFPFYKVDVDTIRFVSGP